MELFDRKTSETIDEALLTYFKSPNSFTGEDVVEISCHGSPVLIRQILDDLLELGARLAGPGEFTLRAVANGRIDLAEAEAVRDLIEAQSTAAARQAIRQMRGAFSTTLQPIKDDLLDSIVVLESALEFVEDDLPEVQSRAVREKLTAIAGKISTLAETFRAGRLLREGIQVAIVGRPNVGKSSLFNALLGHERAIVTDVAGTTRDQINESLVIENIPIHLIDTAGLRQTSDVVESIGVERSRMTMADVDLVVVLMDGSTAITPEDRAVIDSVRELQHIVVVNKTDMNRTWTDGDIGMSGLVSISAKTGAGIDVFKKSLVVPFTESVANTDAGLLVSDARHHDLLRRSASEIETSIELLEDHASEEFVLVGLHNALRYLGEITGETTTEDMLTRIFSTFCIGK